MCRFLYQNLEVSANKKSSHLCLASWQSLYSFWKKYRLHWLSERDTHCGAAIIQLSFYPCLTFQALRQRRWNSFSLRPLFLQWQRAFAHFLSLHSIVQKPYHSNYLALHFVNLLFACPLLHPFHLCDGNADITTHPPTLSPILSSSLPLLTSSCSPPPVPSLGNLALSVTVEVPPDWNKRPLIADQPAVKPGKDMS